MSVAPANPGFPDSTGTPGTPEPRALFESALEGFLQQVEFDLRNRISGHSRARDPALNTNLARDRELEFGRLASIINGSLHITSYGYASLYEDQDIVINFLTNIHRNDYRNYSRRDVLTQLAVHYHQIAENIFAWVDNEDNWTEGEC